MINLGDEIISLGVNEFILLTKCDDLIFVLSINKKLFLKEYGEN